MSMKQTIELSPQNHTDLTKRGSFLWIREIDRLLRGEATQLSTLREGGWAHF